MQSYAEPKQKENRGTGQTGGFSTGKEQMGSVLQPASAGTSASNGLQAMMDSSPAATQFKRFRHMAHRRPQARELAQLQTRMNRRGHKPSPDDAIQCESGGAKDDGPGSEYLPQELLPAQRMSVAGEEKGETLQPAQLRIKAPNHTGLPDGLKSGVESLSGISLDNVKVHYNSSQPAQLNALAYAQGRDIHMAPGQERHLPHEAWHLVQQAQGRVKPTMQMKDGIPINTDKGLEHEADVMGARAIQMREGMHDTSLTAPRSCDAPMQLKITMSDGTVYDDVSATKTVIGKIRAETGEWDKELGGTLASFINHGDHGPYDNYTALLAGLRSRRKAGVQAQVVGKEREKKVAITSGGSVADTGRYGQDEFVYLNGSDRNVKLDVKGPSYYGIVGGPAKARNLEKFKTICRDLRDISAQDGKEPRVYCTRDTPANVIKAASEIVGPGNVYEVESGRVWSLYGSLQNAIKWVAQNPGKTLLGLTGAALAGFLAYYRLSQQ